MYDDLKIAITGAAGESGHAVRARLAERHVPAEHVRLLETMSEEAIISEYAGQPTLIGTVEPGALVDRNVVFLCGSAEESGRCLMWERKRGAVFVDLSGVTATRPDVPIVNVEVNASALQDRPRTVAVPHAISYAITTTLASLEQTFGLERVSAVVIRPVSDFGEPGIEELHRQTVSLLNFTDMPRRVFGRQLGFNLLPHSALSSSLEGPSFETRLAREIDRVFGWEAPRMALRALIAPVFHGQASLVHLELRERATLAAARKVMAGSPGLTLAPPSVAPPSPVEIVSRAESLVADLALDGVREGGFWAWIVGSDFAAHAARNAVEIAGRILSG